MSIFTKKKSCCCKQFLFELLVTYEEVNERDLVRVVYTVANSLVDGIQQKRSPGNNSLWCSNVFRRCVQETVAFHQGICVSVVVEWTSDVKFFFHATWLFEI